MKKPDSQGQQLPREPGHLSETGNTHQAAGFGGGASAGGGGAVSAAGAAAPGAQQDGAVGAQQLATGAQQLRGAQQVRGAQQLLCWPQPLLQQLFCLQHFVLQHFCLQQLRAWTSAALIAKLTVATTTAASDNSLRVIACSPLWTEMWHIQTSNVHPVLTHGNCFV